MPARGTAAVNPGNLTGTRFAAAQRVQETRRKQAERERAALEALADAAGSGDGLDELAARHDGAAVFMDGGKAVVSYVDKYAS